MILTKNKTLILLLLLLTTACTGNSSAATPTAVPTPIVSEKPTYTVQRGTVTQVVQLTGRVLPSKQQDLAFVTSGYVQDVFFKQGDAVKAGELIARLDGVERYAADIADAQLSLDQANYDLQALKQEAPVKAAQAYVAVTQAKAALDQAQAKRDRLNLPRVSDPLALQKLQQDRDQASQALDAARQAYAADPNNPARLDALISAQASFNQAQNNLSWALGKPSQADIDQADADLALAKANYQVAQVEWSAWQSGMDASELHLAESKVADAQARLTLAQKAQETIELRAPFDGQVVSIGIASGSQATAFTAVATVADPSILVISAISTPQNLNQLGVGQAASVKLSSHPDQTYTAHVSRVPLSSATSGDQSIIITLDNTNLALTLGEVATVTVQIDQHQDVLWLPPVALSTFQGQDSVLVQVNGIQRRVDVSLGLKSSERVEILAGLEEGQVVVGP